MYDNIYDKILHTKVRVKSAKRKKFLKNEANYNINQIILNLKRKFQIIYKRNTNFFLMNELLQFNIVSLFLVEISKFY